MADERERGQPQAGGPAFGPGDQLLERRPGDLHAGGQEELTGLLHREPQVRAAELGEVGVEPQAMQPQPDVATRGEHQSQLGRGLGHKQLELPHAVGRLELVEIVDDEPQRLIEPAQLVEEAPDDDVRIEVGRRGERADQP